MAKVLSDNPRVVLEEKFLSDEEVAHLVQLAEGKYTPSTVIDAKSGENVRHEGRTGSLVFLDVGPTPVVSAIEERIAAVTGTRLVQGEAIQIVKYGVGEKYDSHLDWFNPEREGTALQLKTGGQRSISCILYLKTPTEGGETHFPKIPLTVKPVAGDMLVFCNIDGNGAGVLAAEHGGLPVVEGEKIIATRWIRQRAADGSEEPVALKAKVAAEAAIEVAKLAAMTAAEAYKKVTEDEMGIRQTVCYQEIAEVLKRHNCRMHADATVQIGRGGTLQVGAEVTVIPNPPAQAKEMEVVRK